MRVRAEFIFRVVVQSVMVGVDNFAFIRQAVLVAVGTITVRQVAFVGDIVRVAIGIPRGIGTVL